MQLKMRAQIFGETLQEFEADEKRLTHMVYKNTNTEIYWLRESQYSEECVITDKLL